MIHNPQDSVIDHRSNVPNTPNFTEIFYSIVGFNKLQNLTFAALSDAKRNTPRMIALITITKGNRKLEN